MPILAIASASVCGAGMSTEALTWVGSKARQKNIAKQASEAAKYSESALARTFWTILFNSQTGKRMNKREIPDPPSRYGQYESFFAKKYSKTLFKVFDFSD